MSNAGVGGRNPIIPLVSKIDKANLPVVTLEVYVTVGGDNLRRKESLPTITDEDEAELVIYTILQFREVYPQGRLHLSTGQKRFDNFQRLVFGQARTYWTQATTGLGVTLADFDTAIANFVAKYVDEDNGFADQDDYLSTVRKPMTMTCKLLATRLLEINGYMALFPGQNGAVPYNALDLKRKFYAMMPPSWRDKWSENSPVPLTDNDVTLARLEKFMSNQEVLDRRRRSRDSQVARQAGRGNARQGRRGGRGYRGYGRHQGYVRPAANQDANPAPFQRPRLDYVNYQYGRGYYRPQYHPPSPVRSFGRGQGGRYQGRGRVYQGRGRTQQAGRAAYLTDAHYMEQPTYHGEFYPEPTYDDTYYQDPENQQYDNYGEPPQEEVHYLDELFGEY